MANDEVGPYLARMTAGADIADMAAEAVEVVEEDKTGRGDVRPEKGRHRRSPWTLL